MKKKTFGFTMIELIVTVTIIALLMAVGVVSYGTTTRKSRDAKRKSDVEQIRQALEMYRADNSSYPNVGTSWVNASTDGNLQTALVTGGYMPAVPTDPKSDYQYSIENTGAGPPYYAYCLSAYLESENPTDSCTPDPAGSDPDHNYGIKNP